jgi:hypothetical protein
MHVEAGGAQVANDSPILVRLPGIFGVAASYILQA